MVIEGRGIERPGRGIDEKARFVSNRRSPLRPTIRRSSPSVKDPLKCIKNPKGSNLLLHLFIPLASIICDDRLIVAAGPLTFCLWVHSKVVLRVFGVLAEGGTGDAGDQLGPLGIMLGTCPRA